MQHITEAIRELVITSLNVTPHSIEKIPQSGSDRMYFRIYFPDQQLIATYNNNVAENNTFINFSRHFQTIGAPVPGIIAVNDNVEIYVQQDLGDTSLLNTLEKEGYTEHVFDLYKKSLKALTLRL